MKFKDSFNFDHSITHFALGPLMGLTIVCNIIVYFPKKITITKWAWTRIPLTPALRKHGSQSQKPIWSTVLTQAGLYRDPLSQKQTNTAHGHYK